MMRHVFERTGPRRSSPACRSARRRPPRGTPAPAAAVSPGSAPGAESVTSISNPSNTSRRCAAPPRLGAVRREPVVDLDLALVRDHVAGDAAARCAPRSAPRGTSQPSIVDRAGPRTSASRRSTSPAAWIALTPSHERAECARRPVVRTSDPHRALAAGLDHPVRRLQQHREVGRQPAPGAPATTRLSPLRSASTSSAS